MVIVIITIAGGLGGGMYVGSYQRIRVAGTARDLFLLARYARTAAIERQQAHTLHVDRKNGRCWVTTAKRDAQGLAWEQVIVKNSFCRPVALPEGVQVEQVAVDRRQGNQPRDQEEAGDTIVFLADGTADAVVVQIGDDRTHYTLRINASTGKGSLVAGQAPASAEATVDLEAHE